MRGLILVGLSVLLAVSAVPAGAHEENDFEERIYSHPIGGPDVEHLHAYGEWVRVPTYGRVWRPRVTAEWRPYWRGHWAWQGEWVWVSSDPWGDAPFHYGEWTWSSRYGWVWVPGVEWAPARVTWIIDGPVIAWAPIGIEIRWGSEPRFWSYAETATFRRSIVRPMAEPPRRVHLRGPVARSIDRVGAPDHRTRREMNLLHGTTDRRVMETRVTTPRQPIQHRQTIRTPSQRDRRLSAAPPARERHQGSRGTDRGRGFERREAR